MCWFNYQHRVTGRRRPAHVLVRRCDIRRGRAGVLFQDKADGFRSLQSVPIVSALGSYPLLSVPDLDFADSGGVIEGTTYVFKAPDAKTVQNWIDAAEKAMALVAKGR